jgi:DNA-binding response OmpR family regulator
MAHILAIDDEPDILALIRNALMESGHKVDTADCADSINVDKLIDYDLILLDIMMPGMDGMAFCKQIRNTVDCPILFLTAKTQETDIVEGLGNGADDYITKPFGIEELQARVNAHLRREQREKHAVLNTSGIRFDLSAKEVSIKEKSIPLTKSEYEICEFLAKNRGQVFSKEQIYDSVYGYSGESDSSTISEHVKNIRSKFLVYEASPILTVWGIGYKWA